MIKEQLADQKINIFYICNEGAVNKDLSAVAQLNNMEQHNSTQLYIARRHHFHLMSKYFNLYNGYNSQELVEDLNHCIIYLIPDITCSGLSEINLKILSKYKGKLPIIIRHHDPYDPKKFDINLLQSNSDLVLTYAEQIINNKNIRFSTMFYDIHLYHTFNFPAARKRLACMITNNRIRPGYQRTKEEFKQYGIDGNTEREARRELARYIDVDVYGQEGWSPLLPNYWGAIHPFDQKYVTLSKYKFNLVVDTVTLDAYVSEKILDSFLVPTVPVYLGTNKISNFIPRNCYISMSEFDNYRDLIVFLLSMNQQEYLNYFNNILNNRHKIFETFSTRTNVANQIYEWYNSVNNTNLGLSILDLDEIDRSIRRLNLKISNSYTSYMKRQFKLTKMRLDERFRKILHG